MNLRVPWWQAPRRTPRPHGPWPAPHHVACHLVLALAWALASAGAQAGPPTVYRCGNSYSQAPCAGGQAVDAADPRSTEQQAQAEAMHQREARLARRLARERQREELAAARQGAARIGAPEARAEARPRPAGASVPADRPANKKPRRSRSA